MGRAEDVARPLRVALAVRERPRPFPLAGAYPFVATTEALLRVLAGARGHRARHIAIGLHALLGDGERIDVVIPLPHGQLRHGHPPRLLVPDLLMIVLP